MHRVRVAREQLRSGTVHLRGGEHRHLRGVMRLPSAARIGVVDGEGRSFEAQIPAIGASAAEIAVLDEIERRTEAPLQLPLAVAIAKGAKLDWVVEKATELG